MSSTLTKFISEKTSEGFTFRFSKEFESNDRLNLQIIKGNKMKPITFLNEFIEDIDEQMLIALIQDKMRYFE